MPPSLPAAATEADRIVEAGRTARLDAAFAREGQALLRRALIGRIVALAAIGAWIVANSAARDNLIGALYYLILLGAFVVLGALQLVLRGSSRNRDWHKYAFIIADVGLLAFTLTAPPLWGSSQVTALMGLGSTTFVFFIVILAGTALSNSPHVVLCAGGAIIVAWTVAVLWPDPQSPWRSGLITAQELWAQIIVAAATSCLIAFSVARARSVAARQAVAEYERANLGRHFSPNMVDQLAASDAALRAVSVQNVAVLFTDIVGFTALSAALPPEAVVALLREHFARLEQMVFRHGGTLDKYLGDGLMATFGTPRAGPDDATRALACGRGMLETLSDWNRERVVAGAAPVRIGVGIHYGPVVMGNIGGAGRLEFTVIGDTVNIASRIEGKTRELGYDLLVSAALVEAIGRESGAGLSALNDLGPHSLRGREGTIGLWGWSHSP